MPSGWNLPQRTLIPRFILPLGILTLASFLYVSIRYHLRIFQQLSYQTLGWLNGIVLCIKKQKKVSSNFLLIKSSRNNFIFYLYLSGYVFNESSKEFWKNSNFEKMRAGFLWRCQNSLRQNSPEIMHFQAWKKIS